jgi:hypothetical protein
MVFVKVSLVSDTAYPFGSCFSSAPVQEAIHPDSKRTAGPHRLLSLLDCPTHKHT